MGRIVNRSELAESFGVALTTVDQWLNTGLPYIAKPERKGQSGWKIDLSAVLNWHRERERENALGDIAQIDETEAKRRKLAAEASLAELDLALKQGAAVAISDFEASWAAMIGAARAKMLGLGMALGNDVAQSSDPSECSAIIDSAVKEALRELAEFEPELQIESAGYPESTGEDSEGAQVMGTASESYGKPVGGRRTTAKS